MPKFHLVNLAIWIFVLSTRKMKNNHKDHGWKLFMEDNKYPEQEVFNSKSDKLFLKVTWVQLMVRDTK